MFKHKKSILRRIAFFFGMIQGSHKIYIGTFRKEAKDSLGIGNICNDDGIRGSDTRTENPNATQIHKKAKNTKDHSRTCNIT